MNFSDLAAGSSIFVDANTLVYHFISDQNYGAACTALLERVERQEVQGWISTTLSGTSPVLICRLPR